jgi:hypothetical protein
VFVKRSSITPRRSLRRRLRVPALNFFPSLFFQLLNYGAVKGKIIIFRLDKKMSGAERARFFRRLYGYVDRSNYGRYTYERRGLMSEIPHLSPARSVIIVRDEDAGKLVSFLRSHNAEVLARDIKLEDEDIEKLRDNQ